MVLHCHLIWFPLTFPLFPYCQVTHRENHLLQFPDTACCFSLPCLCTYGSLGRILFSSSQPSPPEARSGRRTRIASLEDSLGLSCPSPDRNTWYSVAASASVEILEGDSGPGTLWHPQHGPWPVKKRRDLYMHFCPWQHGKGRAYIVKNPLPLLSGEKRRTL